MSAETGTGSGSTPAPGPAPFDWQGPDEWRAPIERALREVIDPELSLNIVDLGLVLQVAVEAQAVQVELTMTSAACPSAGVIVGEVEAQLDRVLPPEIGIDVHLVWDPPWTPARLSPRARLFLQG
jgi:metal-sulfur cluster biosynthetic enzyme